MPNHARLAEHLLSLVMSRSRSASVIGDLLEACAGTPLLFWRAVLMILLAGSWRWILAYAVAAYLSGSPLSMLLTGLNHVMVASPRTLLLFLVITTFTVLLVNLAAASLIRYGVRGRFTQMALGLALWYIATILLERFTLTGALLAWAVALPATFLVPHYRAAARAVWVTMAAGICLFGATLVLLTLVVLVAGGGHLVMPAPPVIKAIRAVGDWFVYGLLLVMLIAAAQLHDDHPEQATV